MATFDIRLAELSDARKIAAMSRDYIEHGLGWKYQESAVRHMISDVDHNVIVATFDGRVIGFAIMHYEGFEAHLILFAVLPELRRQQAGTALLKWLTRTAEVAGAQVIYVEMRRNNSTGRRFYESIGFKPMEKLQEYYRAREDGLRMALDLRRQPVDGPI